jgi:hypothetical protein
MKEIKKHLENIGKETSLEMSAWNMMETGG